MSIDPIRSAVTWTAIAVTSILTAAQVAPPPGDETPPDATAATGTDDGDPGWPRTFEVEGGRVVIHQPQLTLWKDDRVQFGAAVTVEPADTAGPEIGSLLLGARISADLEERLVTLYDIELVETQFEAPEQAEAAQALVAQTIPTAPGAMALDRFVAAAEALLDLDRDALPVPRVLELSENVPNVVYALMPTVLVLIDGAPILRAIEGTELLHVLNTRWDIVFHRKSGRYWLLIGESWFGASRLRGSWTFTAEMPPTVDRIPADHPRAAMRAAAANPQTPDDATPQVVVRNRPTELITTDGEAVWREIDGTDLLYCRNTDSDLFLDAKSREYYLLLSGRWVHSGRIDGAWRIVESGKLPSSFARIPHDHPMAWVLASVPKTPESMEAAVVAHVPQQAAVKRDEATVDVTYDGAPAFRDIDGTELAYAINTSFEVIRCAGRYYCCYEAAWFVADDPLGPWALCDEIPDAIYAIGADEPLHHTTYVYVYDSDDDEIIYGYTGGYYGNYWWNGAVVYGTGYYWPGYCGRNVYWGRPWSYGAHVYYHPYACGYVWGGSYASPWGRADVRAGYNPHTDVGAAGYRGRNAYARWGRGVARRGSDWVQAGYVDRARRQTVAAGTSDGRRVVATQTGRSRGFVATSGEDLYVGRNGRVFKRDDGAWYRRDGREWANAGSVRPRDLGRDPNRAGAAGTPPRVPGVRQPGTVTGRPGDPLRAPVDGRGGWPGGGPSGAAGVDQLRREAAARQTGAARQQRYHQWRQAPTGPRVNRGWQSTGRMGRGAPVARRGGAIRRR